MIGMLVAYNDKDLLQLQGRTSSLSYIQYDIYTPMIKVTTPLPNRPSLSLSTVLESKVVTPCSLLAMAWPDATLLTLIP
jgi:hypothetical protein